MKRILDFPDWLLFKLRVAAAAYRVRRGQQWARAYCTFPSRLSFPLDENEGFTGCELLIRGFQRSKWPLHTHYLEVGKAPPVENEVDLARFIRAHPDGVVYAIGEFATLAAARLAGHWFCAFRRAPDGETELLRVDATGLREVSRTRTQRLEFKKTIFQTPDGLNAVRFEAPVSLVD